MEPFLGQIMMVPYNFAPHGWAFCDGQIMPIDQNTALFALIGTVFGGDGRTTFALPDLRGRVPVHVGGSQGPGVSSYQLGEMGGQEQVLIEPRQIGADIKATQALPDGKDLFLLNAGAVGPQPVDIRQPYVAINFIIALQGVFPSRV
ncbi:MAG TPA: tail fiber protein [Pyrinomonadaceae bacterium]|nr:tail fiber protein [Pyrinomonadaceae bacterium]